MDFLGAALRPWNSLRRLWEPSNQRSAVFDSSMLFPGPFYPLPAHSHRHSYHTRNADLFSRREIAPNIGVRPHCLIHRELVQGGHEEDIEVGFGGRPVEGLGLGDGVEIVG